MASFHLLFRECLWRGDKESGGRNYLYLHRVERHDGDDGGFCPNPNPYTPKPQGFAPRSISGYDPNAPTTNIDSKREIYGTSWGPGQSVGSKGRWIEYIAFDGSHTIESSHDTTADATTHVQLTTTLRPGYSYYMRGRAQNSGGGEYYSPINNYNFAGGVDAVHNKGSYSFQFLEIGTTYVKMCVKALMAQSNASTVITYFDATDPLKPTEELDIKILPAVTTGTGSVSSNTITVEGLTPGHHYLFAAMVTLDGGLTEIRPKHIWTASVTSRSATQITTDTGWQTLQEQLHTVNEVRSVIRATRVNHELTLDLTCYYRVAIYPGRFMNIDTGLDTGEVGVQQAIGYDGYKDYFCYALSPLFADQSALFQEEVSGQSIPYPWTTTAQTTGTLWSLDDYPELETNQKWIKIGQYRITPYSSTPNPGYALTNQGTIVFSVPEAGDPQGLSLPSATTAPSASGTTNTVTMTGTSWGDNVTAGRYELECDGGTKWIIGERDKRTLEEDAGTEARPNHTFTFESPFTNGIYKLTGTIWSKAGTATWGRFGSSGSGVLVTAPAPPLITLTANEETSAAFSFASQSSGQILPESYFWKFEDEDAWHPSTENPTGLTTGKRYTVQVKTTANISDLTPADIGYEEWGSWPKGFLVAGGGESETVNGLTFTAGGEVVILKPHIIVQKDGENKTISHLYINEDGEVKRVSKLYVQHKGQNRLIFRDYNGDAVAIPTVVSITSQEGDKKLTITLDQTRPFGVLVDWGDQSGAATSEVLEGAQFVHTYQESGNYDVVVSPLSDCSIILKNIEGCEGEI